MSPLPPVFHCSAAPPPRHCKDAAAALLPQSTPALLPTSGAKTFIDTEKSRSSSFSFQQCFAPPL